MRICTPALEVSDLRLMKVFGLGICLKDKVFPGVVRDKGPGSKYEQIGFPVNFTLKGVDGVLDGKLQQGLFPEGRQLLEMAPIWLRYRPDPPSFGVFKGLRTLISNQTSLIDFKFYSESADLRSLSDFVLEVLPDSTIASAWLADLNLEGKLSRIHGYIDEESGIGMHGLLEELRTNSHKGIPQVTNLAGSLYLHPNGFLLNLIQACSSKIP